MQHVRVNFTAPGQAVSLGFRIDQLQDFLRFGEFTRTQASLALTMSTLKQLEKNGASNASFDYALKLVLGNIDDIPLFSATPTITPGGKRDTDQKTVITVDRTNERFIFCEADNPALDLPIEYLDLLAAPVENRVEDAFAEARDDDDSMERRQIWTTACLAAADLLPASPIDFLAAAEAFSVTIAPEIHWEATNASMVGRLAAAIHAGILLYDPTADLMTPHPSLSGWHRILGNDGREVSAAKRETAIAFSALTRKSRSSLRAWADHVARDARISGHDMVSAQKLLRHHQHTIAAIRERIKPHVTPFPMPAPEPTIS